MLKREEALRIIRSVARFAGITPVERSAGNDLILELRLPPDAEAPVRANHQEIPQPQRRYRVLNVDDTDRQSDLIYYYLRGNYDVETARSADEALMLALGEPYDYVLMDLKLGAGMSGFELAEVLRKTDTYSRSPIVALSGYNARQDVDRSIKAGCSAFLSKPFLKEDLLKMLHQLEPLVVSRNQRLN
jgi:CheY-like chemotaxis protein